MRIVMLFLASISTGAAIMNAYITWKLWRESKKATKAKTHRNIWVPTSLMVVFTVFAALLLRTLLLHPPLGATPAHLPTPNITWLNPTSGTEVGWKTIVTLSSPTKTETVTILVQPHASETFYVQPGARLLFAGRPESFEIQLAGGRQQQIGTKFDIIALCSNSFKPDQWSLDSSEVPHSAAVSRVTVSKAAGVIHLTRQQPPNDTIQVKGEIWTPNGGALVVKQNQRYKVFEILEPSPVGSQFERVVQVPSSQHNMIYLLVRQEGAPTLSVDQEIYQVPEDLYWLYGPAKLESQRKY